MLCRGLFGVLQGRYLGGFSKVVFPLVTLVFATALQGLCKPEQDAASNDRPANEMIRIDNV